MRKKRTVPSEMLDAAVLNGIPCRAIAWIEATHVSVLGGRGKPNSIEGVRTWHGTAVVDKEAFTGGQWFTRPVLYAGRLLDGEEVQEICSEVYITAMRRRKARTAASQGGDFHVHIEFTGAGAPVLGRQGQRGEQEPTSHSSQP